jgi:hypothetical protein
MTLRRENLFAFLWIALGLAIQIFGYKRNDAPGSIYALLSLSGTIILLAACALYAQQKGQSRNWGFLAILSFFGVIILLLLPRRTSS